VRDTYVDIASVAAESAVPMPTSSASDADTDQPAPKRMRAGSVPKAPEAPPAPLAPCKEPSTPQQRRGSGRQLTF